MEFVPVELEKHLALSIEFRRDAHNISYGSEKGFDVAEITQWYELLKEKNPQGFQHIIINGNIVGQLEFKSAITKADGTVHGYINLLYLIPKYRDLGYGRILLDHILTKFRNDGCTEAQLRYLQHNKRAAHFYKKHHWIAVGGPTEQGQLMRKFLI